MGQYGSYEPSGSGAPAARPAPLAFSCYVFTSDARLLLTMRGHAKKTWPGVWTNSCYGHPGPGSPSPARWPAASRDELGLPGVRADLVLPAFRHRMPPATGPPRPSCARCTGW